MKKAFHYILILTFACIIAVSFNGLASEKKISVSSLIILSNDSQASDIVLTAETVPEIKVSTTVTDSGLTMKVGRIKNDGDATINEMILIPVDSKKYYFNITIYPKTVWTYATINGITIVPETSARILSNTSYYPEGKQLKISLDHEGLKKLWIFTEENSRPRFMLSDSDILWGYDDDKKIITVKSEKFNHEVRVFWTDFVPSGDVYIEDTSNREVLGYRLNTLENEKENMTAEIDGKKIYMASMEAQINNLSSAADRIVFEEGNLTRQLNSINGTVGGLENTITGSVIVSPVSYIIYIIVLIILIVILIEALFFRKKAEKEEKPEEIKENPEEEEKPKKKGKKDGK